ncbi:MAG: outer membrane beta-barrel protein [Paraglaciecola sp.]|uniref:outer membrane beta-barrel protein n=1 Tax=Pseudomonadati TaxID=3379134 RepID=UPI00273E8D5F|nr:outer membrane beta-barrel protein [Paraglaciecola sp.]MDP5032476.1 outer membrane beta-barrel protein [Paraglaciecola sp.]MDP5133480.1 outer membrane beta-barrel protein [Paraglaciecola sp.]
MKKILSLSALSLAFLGLSGAAQAEMDAPGIYVGAGYGQYSIQFEDRENDIDFDDDSAVLKGYIGAQFNRYISLELAYQNFDEANDIDNNAEIDGLSLAAIASLPLTENLSIFAKGGWFEWDADVSADIPAVGTVTSSQDGGDIFYGAGLQYSFTKNIQARIEYERFELEDDIDPDLDVASVSIQYMF